MRTALTAIAPLAAALAGCGTGLYDAAGVPAVEATGLACGTGQVVCGGVCTAESRTQCGATCADCTQAGTAPTNGAWACLSGGTCGYECVDGFLKCLGGCCATTALAAGGSFTCALLDDGSLRCWGANESGQLGDGSTTDRPAPVKVPLPSPAIGVGVGEHHACAVLSGGAITCWGANDGRQVSASPVSPVLAPAASPVMSGAVELALGAAHSCARLGSGAVVCWGSNAAGQLGPGPGAPVASLATALAAGANHACAVVAGAVKCWGANDGGQLGDGTTSPRIGTIVTPISSGITLLAASSGQSCASTGVSNNASIDDVVKCWGDSLDGTFLFATPQLTPAIPLKDATQSTLRFDVSRIVTGRKHVCVERKTESVECFGADNSRGQLGGTPLGTGESVPVPLPVTVPAVVALAAGSDHTCAALGDGRLRCWGANARGQLGNGATVDPGVGAITIPSGR